VSEYAELEKLDGYGGVEYRRVAISAHKEPTAAILKLHQLIQEVPDTVIIASVGRSNGLGPVLAANSTVPVITVPNTKDVLTNAREDVWSALNMPSDVPVLTMINPKNAVQAAQLILASRNPYLYMKTRIKREAKFANVVAIK
jgi:phosphoribosylaminoimidazole carboxylase / phosphoribosylaminoimidazole-succinocarboxamide synthase